MSDLAYYRDIARAYQATAEDRAGTIRELLAACDGILAMHDGGPNSVSNWDLAFHELRAAVAKARGHHV